MDVYVHVTARADCITLAFASWKSVSPATKAAVFQRGAAIADSEGFKAKALKTVQAETGTPKLWAGFVNAGLSATFLASAGDMTYSIKGEILPSDIGARSFVQKLPTGVVFIISPWNAPLGLSLMTCVPAIAAGNTVVLKTSEYSPGSQLLTGELLHEAGLPAGVLNIVHTSREESGPRVAEIIAHPYVRKIGFTGSDRVGKIIAAEAAKYLKPCVFELGGKAPAVVLDDASLDAAARAIVSGAMTYSGQMCVSTERVIVQRQASEELISKIKSYASKLKAEDPFKDGTKLGCVFNQGSAQNIINMVRGAINDGAELLLGDLKADGAFVQPHVVLGTKPGNALWDRESFGPVMTIAVVDTVDEAVDLANASAYSLTSSLWTNNMGVAMDVSSRIRAGKVIVNGVTYGTESRFHQAGLGGSSGYGSFSVEEFVNTQLVTFQSAESQKAYITVDF